MLRFTLFLFFAIKICHSANILFINPVPSPSHYLWNKILSVGLVNKGHNVTMLAPDSDEGPLPKNFHLIKMNGVYQTVSEHVNFSNAKPTISQKISIFLTYRKISCSSCSKSDGLKKVFDYPENFKFDLIIVDNTLGPCLYSLIQRFNYPPTVAATAFLLPSYVSSNFGNHQYPGYLPFYLTDFDEDMSFWQRVQNYLLTNLGSFYFNNFENKMLHSFVQEEFPQFADGIEKLERHISLVLSNTDPLLDYPQALPPNIIPVGGLHASATKKLPQDLQHILDNSTNGAIVISLGTNVRSDKLTKEKRDALLNAFSKFPHTIIWKFESDLDHTPKNVIIKKWLPQKDILAHPNVKLLINHGGALSTHEAMYHGVPIVGVPFVTDQHLNVKMLVKRKLGLLMDFSLLTPEYVHDILKEVLYNPIYTNNMKLLASRFKDQPMTPLDRAIFWIEHTIRHKGEQFLNTAARDLPSIVSSSKDVELFLLISVVGALLTVYVSISKLCGRRKHCSDKVKTN